tara:strand:- start:416 stop:712 length:297 start_codon:yes stop_codon:yes gene_type:complete
MGKIIKKARVIKNPPYFDWINKGDKLKVIEVNCLLVEPEHLSESCFEPAYNFGQPLKRYSNMNARFKEGSYYIVSVNGLKCSTAFYLINKEYLSIKNK